MEQNQTSLNEIYKILLELKAKMQKFDKMDKYIEDLEFARRIEEAYQRHEEGDFKIKSSKEFSKELKQWQM